MTPKTPAIPAEAGMALQPDDFNYFRGLVQRRAAIVLEDEKAYLVESRLSLLSHREGFPSLSALATHLRCGGDDRLQRKVVEAMTTNETSFFRDGHPFRSLHEGVFPQLLRRRTTERSLTVWCAGCSSGQEPYSVAMLLREIVPALDEWNVRILASDLSTEVLARCSSVATLTPRCIGACPRGCGTSSFAATARSGGSATTSAEWWSSAP